MSHPFYVWNQCLANKALIDFHVLFQLKTGTLNAVFK